MKSGRPLDYQGRRKFTVKVHVLMNIHIQASSLDSLCPQQFCSRQEAPLGKTSQLHWYWHFAQVPKMSRGWWENFWVCIHPTWASSPMTVSVHTVTSENKWVVACDSPLLLQKTLQPVDGFFRILRPINCKPTEVLAQTSRNRNSED